MHKILEEVEEKLGNVQIATSVRTLNGLEVMVCYTKNGQQHVAFGLNVEVALRKALALDELYNKDKDENVPNY